LFGSVPKLVLDDDELVHFDTIEGEVPSPLSPPSGCFYHPRCPLADEHCATVRPEMTGISNNRSVMCRNYQQQLTKD
jgi:oligopeptide/dipeptide ABC transporter ATP-binding protein